MPTEPILIDTTIEAVGVIEPSWGNIFVIGRDTGGSGSDDTIYEITNLAEAATQFSNTSDIYYAIKHILDQGVYRVYAMRASITNVPAEALTAASLQVLTNFPVAGLPALTNSAVDTIQYTYDEPTDPGVGVMEVNTKTGQYWLNAGTAITCDYNYFDWDAIESALNDYSVDVDLIVFAATYADEQFYGDLDGFYLKCDTNSWVTVIMSQMPWTDKTAAQIVTDLGKYSSRNVVGIAHKDATANEDPAAAVAGRLSVTIPWDKLMWKRIADLTLAMYFTKSEVDTILEGGKVNAIIYKQNNDRPSDGLTVAGSTYKFIDITRTRYYAESLIIYDLTLLIMNNRLPFTSDGIRSVKGSIEKSCQRLVDEGALRKPWIDTNDVLQYGFRVNVPEFSSVSDADRTARTLNDVYVTIVLAGHIQSISLNLAIQL